MKLVDCFFFFPKNERHFNFHYWMSYITWFWQPDKSDKHGSKLQFRLLDCKIYLEMSSSMWLVSDPVLSNSTQHNQHMQQRPYSPGHTWYILRADSRLNLESALYSVPDVSSQDLLCSVSKCLYYLNQCWLLISEVWEQFHKIEWPSYYSL